MPRRPYDSARETNRPGREAKQSSARAPRSFARVVSPPRRMLHTDAAAVWRRYRREQEKQHHRRGRGRTWTIQTHRQKPRPYGSTRPAWRLYHTGAQIWTTPERECPAPYRAASGKCPKASTLQKGAKHRPPERNTRGGGGLFCSSQKKANRRGKGKRAGAEIEPPPKDKKRTAAVLRLHTQPKAPAPLCGDYTTANKRPPPFVGDGRNQRINSINLISNSLSTQRQR